jgi:hypothetical protein
MKNKNTLLGIFALAFAIGSAFVSSKDSSGPGYLKIKFVGEPIKECLFVTDCSGGVFDCRARINGTDYVLKLPDCPVLPTRTESTSEPIVTIVDENIEYVVE